MERTQRRRIPDHGRVTAIVHVKDGGTYEYLVGRDALFTLVLLVGTRSKLEADVRIRLVAEGAQADIVGFVIGQIHRHYILNTAQLHESPATRSNLLVKSVLKDSDSFAYHGSIKVYAKAQKTDAYQRNENLLLADTARAESKPMLEILANDVRCTHGATIGTIPEDELWYCASRGITPTVAKGLITEGFLKSGLNRLSDTMTRQEVTRWLNRNLSR